MNKKGFSFIETVVTVVILSTSLLLVYNSYSSIISNEQKRVYYNDPAYIYRTSTVMDFLNYNTNIARVLKDEFAVKQDRFVQQIGINYSSLYENKSDENNTVDIVKAAFEQLINSLSINQIFIIKKELLDDCSFSHPTEGACANGINELNSTAPFVGTLTSWDGYSYYLVIEYSEMSKIIGSDTGKLTKCYFTTEQKYGCKYYYASIPINEVYLT